MTIILIVDDNKDLRALFKLILNNFNILEAENGIEAIEHFKENKPDIILMDILMPEMDGITFLAKVKEAKPHVPRIILTGYADKENAIKAINDVGLFQLVEKPWDNEDILIIFRNGLEKIRLMNRLDEKISEINKAYGDLQDLQKE
ncbi:MAG: response regulator, partial [Candidatus Heimdallarchaeota archaeon]|nr:response regulator [Candidatus Heimdallarchaeota archaeon]